MTLGLSIDAFTQLHVVISLVGIAVGLIVVIGMVLRHRMAGWTGVFLAATVATSVTGFMFPSNTFGPAHVVGVISLIVLVPTLLGLYVFRLAGAWRWIYVSGAVLALYLNVFVAVVQAFQKIFVLAALAPNQSEPPFQIAQLVVLALFGSIGGAAVWRFRPPLPARA
ncbi:hypothetical protein [Rhodoplanes sp. SY1]|uniref:hypothetical protein n=1 Tax=Rhodoplanes sp. SY1 TaxID=3166646 RepID=UPI0038B4AFA4